MSVIVGFTIIVMILFVGYMSYRLFLRRTLLILITLCLQFIALTLAIISFISNVNVLTSSSIETFYIIFGVAIPGIFFVYDYTRMMKKIKNHGVYEGLVQALPKDADIELNINLNKKYINNIIKERQISDLMKYLNVNKDDILKNIKKSLTQAQLFLNNKDYNNAYEIYATLVKLIKNCPGLYFNYGNICYLKENYSEAAQSFKKVLEINEKLIKDINNSNDLQTSEKDKKETEGIIDILSSEDSIKHDEYAVFYNLGNAYFKQNKFEAAIEVYKKALNINPGLENANENIARVLISLDRISEAIEYYKKVVEEDKNNFKVHYIIGKLYSELKKYDEAKLELNESIKINSHCKEAYDTLGLVLTKTGKYEESIAMFKKSVKIEPDDFKGHYSLGASYYKTGKKEKAIESFKKVIELKPENYKSYYNMAIAQEETGLQEEAIESFKKVIELKAEFIDTYNNLGILLSTMGRNLEALDIYIKGLKKNPEEHSLYYNMGITLSGMGRYAEAVEAYKNALEINPDELEIFYHLGAAFTELKKYNEAIEAYKNALKVKTTDSELYYNISVNYSLIKKYDIALDNLKRALELNKELKNDIRFNRAFDMLRNKDEYKAIMM